MTYAVTLMCYKIIFLIKLEDVTLTQNLPHPLKPEVY